MTTPRALSDEELKGLINELSMSSGVGLDISLGNHTSQLALEHILLRAVRYSMDREVPFPSLEKITDAINDGTNGYETELSTLRQLCDELALRLSETDSLLQTYAPHSSTQFKFNGEALTKYNSTKGSEG